MGNKAFGLYNKFIVTRMDGRSDFGKKHHGCEYFVLDLDHDSHAPAAIRAYAESCREEYPLLSADLFAKFPTPASPLLPGLERAVPVCACGDSFTSESLCINCVGPLLEDPIPGLERALEICESFSLDPVPAKRIRAEISRLRGEGSDHE